MSHLPRRHLVGLNADVSVIGAGCWTIGGHATNRGTPIGWDDVDPDAAFAGLVRALERGVTLYDTADVYGLGHSERLLGRLLRLAPRQDLAISSKVGYFAGTARHAYHPAQMRAQLATTLDNLGTDHLDIYFLHSSDFGPDDRYLPEAVDLMHTWRDQGVIRAVGMRAPHRFAEEWAAADGPEAVETRRWLYLFDQVRPDVLTARYNLLSRPCGDHETDIFRFARRNGVGVLIKQVFGKGLLLQTGSGPDQRRYSAADHRSTDPAFTPDHRRHVHGRLAPVRDRYGHSTSAMVRLCVQYALHPAPGAAILAGFRNANQIDATIAALDHPLLAEDITQIRAVLHGKPYTD
ncbi:MULTISPECIES: aldo/keto reductase [unclassified Micromonospora]|uniref:aldo/keto reductase n=1 Tax=unclassified Micromonospora TaxID=2617518 RepID=UPI001C230C01|nr:MULTISPECIES: aldo/keto reductase [unclassified Micromonospora]MBU8859218.1 aldo/keto reductase [Micromonospora sp. WMMB482]MDM4778730.1 aldo/keto reductase [Micromonospora sp. b486]